MEIPNSTTSPATQSDLIGRIFDTLNHKPVCDMDDLLESVPSSTRDQLFLEVDRLSRTGELCLYPKKTGAYLVALPDSAQQSFRMF